MRIATYCKLLAATDDVVLSFNWTRTLNRCGLVKELGRVIPQLYAKGNLSREDLITLAEYLPCVGALRSLSSGGLCMQVGVFLEWYRLDLEEFYGK